MCSNTNPTVKLEAPLYELIAFVCRCYDGWIISKTNVKATQLLKQNVVKALLKPVMRLMI